MPTQINSEFPSPERLRAYGDLTFLYFRSKAHEDKPFKLMRWIVQVPVDLKQYKIFYAGDVPRAAVLWAMVNEEADAKIRRGQVLQPAEWRSGSQMWITDVLAPYGQNSARKVIRWVKESTPGDITSIRTMRPNPGSGAFRIVEHNRIDGAQWGARKIGDFQ